MRTASCFVLFAAFALAADKIPGDEIPASTLLTMKRVFVDRFGGGETSAQLRDMIISSIEVAHLFQITENQERADVVLKGSGEDLVFTDQHQSSDNLSVHLTGSSSNHNPFVSDSKSSGIGAGESESSHIVERKHEAAASVRLVNKDGDVIWSATKESLGGKFRGASADVADKIMKQLVQDVERARASSSKQAGNPSR
ncbi:MAG: hypothetical protein JWO80_2659 [Bryobacterales bacterium]|nr:hypothetical protein [Bryobacterales bacterium]